MAERAVFLDRDNTIIDDVGYLGDPAKVKLLPGAATALAAIRRLGYRIIVASNQSGVARGMFTEADVEAVNNEMCNQLRQQAGAHIDASYYCPYHPEASVAEYRLDHDWRKPKPGMLKQAAEDFGLDLGQSWMVGDMPRDIACGAAAGCRTILIKDPDHPAPANESDTLSTSPHFIVKTLADAARIIAREGKNPHPELIAKPVAVSDVVTSASEQKGTPSVSEGAEFAPVPEPIATPTPPAKPIENPKSETQNPPSPASLDPTAFADALAARLAPFLARPSDTRPLLEEILTQLRQQNRAAEVPEFSLARMVAILAQVAVAVCLLMGLYDAVSALPPHPELWAKQYDQLIRAGLWLLGGVVLQGFVIAMALLSRERR